MSIQEWVSASALLRVPHDAIGERSLKLAYCRAQSLCIDVFDNSTPANLKRMTFLEFLEALCRCAYVICHTRLEATASAAVSGVTDSVSMDASTADGSSHAAEKPESRHDIGSHRRFHGGGRKVVPAASSAPSLDAAGSSNSSNGTVALGLGSSDQSAAATKVTAQMIADWLEQLLSQSLPAGNR